MIIPISLFIFIFNLERDTYPDIESAFFELESTLEKNICRKNVSTSIDNEKGN